MAKGCCGGTGTCSCQVIAQGAITVKGSGQPSDPFIFDSNLDFASSANKTFVTIIQGDGSEDQPYTPVVTYADTAQLDDIPDVQAPNPTNGQVLAWDAAQSRWVPVAPATAPVGSVLTDLSLDGDGSAPTPLAVLHDPNRLTGTFPNGIGLTDLGMASTVQHFPDDTTRDTAIPSPFLNQMTTIDTEPGVLWYWTGSAWSLLPNQTTWEVPSGAMLELSGSYTEGLPITVMVVQVDTTTDAAGNFDIFGIVELAGRSGVLTAFFTEGGSVPWKAMVDVDSNKIVGTAYRLGDASVMAGTPVTGTAQAVLY